MKKSFLLLILVLTILLSSCSSPAANQDKGNDNSMSVGAWTSEGGAFKQTAYNVPDGAMSVFSCVNTSR